MPIHSLHVENFKGLREGVEIPIKPITIFVGANSSGKSSCIHALAAMAQTMKFPNDRRPLVLDDEFASVHLGRFIEVIHTKHYTDTMKIGLSIGQLSYRTYPSPTAAPELISGNARCCYCFKSTRRTQDIQLKSAEISIGDLEYRATAGRVAYDVVNSQTGVKTRLPLQGGFLFDSRGSATRIEPRIRLMQFSPLFLVQRALQKELSRTLYLGPFRQSPLRRYPTRGSSPKEVGPQGESTITLLANEIVQSRSRKHISEITRWLQTMGLAKKLEVARVATSDLFDVNFTLDDGASFPIADLGYGLSQILPVLAQCSFADEGSTLLFEQPELHLHSLAIRPLAKVFVEVAKQKKIHVVAETHSRELVGQFQLELRSGNLDPADLVVYKVSREGGRSVIRALEIDPDSFDIYDRWEAGVFTEA